MHKPNLRLKYERERRGWSQAKLAEELGVSTKVVSRWERGSHKPYPIHREGLCRLFGKDADDLGFIEGDPGAQLLPKSAQNPGFVEDFEGDDPLIPPLPNEEEELVGRQELLEVLARRTRPGKCIALTGLPGVGKTALVVALLHHPQVRDIFCDGVLWADLGLRPDLLEKLGDWARHLRLPAAVVAAENSLEARARALRKAIGMRRMLLVVNDAWEVEAALALKVGGPNCALLVTTRLSHIALRITTRDYLYTVPALNAEEGLTLFERWSPEAVAYDKQAAQTLVQDVGGLPLALTLLGRELDRQAHNGQPRRLRDALVRLHKPIKRLHVSEPQSHLERGSSLAPDMPLSLHSVIAVSDVQLDEQARTALRALSVFPPRPNSFSEEVALKVSQVSAESLDTLCDASLLESNGPGRYTLHPLIADYASSHLTDIMPGERLVAYYATFLEDHASDYEALEREFPNLIASLNYASKNGQHALFVRAVNTFVPALLARGFYDLAARHLQRAYEVALWSTGALEQVRLRLNLGKVRYQQGEYKQAREALGEVLNLAREHAYHEQVCHLLILLGMVAIGQGEYHEAQIRLREGLTHARESKYHDAQMEAYIQEAFEQLPASFQVVLQKL